MTLINTITSSRPLAAAITTAMVALGALLALAPRAPAHSSAARAPAHSSAAAKHCASVTFTPASEDMAAEIRATGVSCAYARTFIRDSNGRPPRSYRGFTCARHRVHSESTLPHTRYRCTRASKTIRWKRF